MLTASQVKAATKPGRYGDGAGLSLVIDKRGGKSWVLRIAIDGKRRDLGLGPAATTPLAKAREKARAYREDVAAGGNPMEEKRRVGPPTFREVMADVHQAHSPRWSVDHAASWLRSMNNHAKGLMDVRVDRIGQPDVLRLLQRCREKNPKLAPRMRQRIRQVFAYAQAFEYIAANPAGEGISAALPPAPKGGHHRALDHREVPAALRAIGQEGSTRLALRMVILAAARGGEVRGMTWDEVDLETRTWTLAPSRMKARREHRVPLSDAAVAVLEAARGREGSDYVFPSPAKAGAPLSDQPFADVLAVEGIPSTPHGFRASFRSWCAETGERFDAAEMCLAHRVGGAVVQAYQRSDLLDERRGIMERWGAYCVG